MVDTAVATKPITTKAPVPNPAPSVSGLEGDLAKQTQQAEQDITKYQDSVGKITADFHDQLNTLRQQAPKVPDLKPFQEPEQENPVSMFGSKAGLFATIASLFTRAPLTSSLNAMSAGMKAINEGNAVAYQRSYDEWKQNTEYAFKTFDAENKAYDSLLNLAKTDYDTAISGINTLAKMSEDKPAQMAMLLKGIEGIEQLNIERARLSDDMQANYFKVGIPTKIFNESINEFKIKQGRDPNSQELSNLYQQALAGGTGGIQSTAQMIASYQIPMPTGYALKNMGGDALVGMVRQYNPGYNASKYGAIQAAYKAFTSGDRSKLITSGNVAIQHLGLLKDAFNAMQTNNVQLLNVVKQKWQVATGSPLPTNYDAISGVAADELTKFIVGGGRTGGALTDRQDMKGTIARKMAQGQGAGVFDMYIGLMAGQLNGQRKQYEADDLEQIKPFDDFLLPETASALGAHSGQSDNIPPPAGSVIRYDANGNPMK